LGHAKPYETRYELRVEYFNETMIFVLLYHLILFTKEYIELVDIRNYVGISLIFFTLLLLLVNLVLIAIPALNTLRLKARRWMNIKIRERIRKRESSPEYIAD
jgi:cell division protein FtsW (lipid II flippase)